MKRYFLLIAALALTLLSGCATILRSDVTSFQRWPANANVSSYSFKRNAGQEVSLEHLSYEDLARAQLNQLGLTPAAAGTKGRFEVQLDYGVQTRTLKSQEAVVADPLYWHPAYYHHGFGWRPGYWGYSHYGPTVVGYRTVSRDVSTRRLRVDISEGVNKVFEASATSRGSNGTLSVSMPYLIRSVFDGFPGTNGQSRELEFDVDKGALKERRIIQPR